MTATGPQERFLAQYLLCNISHPLFHESQGSFRIANQPHAVVDPSWAQPPLGNFEPLASTQQDVLLRNADISKCDLPVASWKEKDYGP